jgi:biotin synthesis protein BioG
MNHQLISSVGSDRLILIFAGWAMDPTPFSHLSKNGYDVMVVWDYRALDFDENWVSKYNEICLIAWSFGVFAAASTLGRIRSLITQRIAINGTLSPINDSLGIPRDIFNKTVEGMDERNLRKFYRRMMDSAQTFNSFWEHRPQRPIDELIAELKLYGAYANTLKAEISKWDRAIVGLNDAIFPAANQLKAWTGNAVIEQVEASHYIDIQQVIDRLIVDKSLVSERFNVAQSTYANQAEVQAFMASRLAQLAQFDQTIDRSKHVLEIGCGTGLLTDKYWHLCDPAKTELWDLAPYNLPADRQARFTCCDAETEIRSIDDCSIDVLLSAATVQWFNSLQSFMEQVAYVMAPGGIVALSTFDEGNLRELYNITGIEQPLLSKDDITSLVSEDFEILCLHSEEIKAPFNSVMAMLRHLQETGVNSLKRPSRPIEMVNKIKDNYPVDSDGSYSLIYRPLYIILKKKPS